MTNETTTNESTSSVLLSVRDVTVHHGQLRALDAVSVEVGAGEVIAIIGANGAGKSTLLRTIAGLHHESSGSISFSGRDLAKVPAHRRVTSGISLVPEGRRLFASMTLEENLIVGAHKAADGAFDVAAIYELFPWMYERRKSKVKQFSGGEQQAVSIGRALVANPKVLMLDEVSLGLAPIVIERIYEIVPAVVARGIGVLLVEQDVAQGLRVATRVVCLLEGRITLEGRPDELTSEQIEIAYFGSHLGADAQKGTA